MNRGNFRWGDVTQGLNGCQWQLVWQCDLNWALADKLPVAPRKRTLSLGAFDRSFPQLGSADSSMCHRGAAAGFVGFHQEDEGDGDCADNCQQPEDINICKARRLALNHVADQAIRLLQGVRPRACAMVLQSCGETLGGGCRGSVVGREVTDQDRLM